MGDGRHGMERTFGTFNFFRRLDKDHEKTKKKAQKLGYFGRTANFALGEDALMSTEVFRKWLETPHRSFENRTPLTLMKTISGAEVVRNELIRTQYGVLS